MSNMLPQVFVSDGAPSWVCEKLNNRFILIDEVHADLSQTQAMISGADKAANRIVNAQLMERMPGLEIIVGFGAGYDRIDIGEATSRGITVTNTPNVHTDDVADFTVGLIIATLRQIPQADQFVRGGLWRSGSYPVSSGSLRGKRVGIAGLGAIGKAVARRLAAFDLEIAYFGRKKQDYVSFDYHPTLLSLAVNVDILVLTLPGDRSTNHVVDRNILKALGSAGYLINVSRGSVISETDLLAALTSGQICAAGLDVFADEPEINPEFFSLKNVVLQPHVASATRETRAAMWQLVIDNLMSWSNGFGPITPVPQPIEFPDTL